MTFFNRVLKANLLYPTGFNGTHCELNMNECVGVNCHNGSCVDDDNGFQCRCRQGFAGKFCDKDVDECSPNPCVDGAKCTNLVGDFKCHCPPGATGKRCDQRVNACASNPCQNGAICRDRGKARPQCVCKAGFKGW